MSKIFKIALCTALCVRLLIAAVPLPAMADEIPAPVEEGVRIVGIQTAKSPGETTTSVRFIGAVDSLEYERVGFMISVRWKDAEGEIHIGSAVLDKGTSTVYRSILADEETVTAEELGAEYLIALAVSYVPIGENVQVDFSVTPYSVAQGLTLTEEHYMKYSNGNDTYSFINGIYNENAEALRPTLARADGTTVRVMQSNVKDDGINNDTRRAELLFDTYLAYEPDIITFNELNPSGRPVPIRLKELLEPYYTIIDAEYLDLFLDQEGQSNLVTQRKYGFPIAYRKNAGLTLIDSGFSYHTKMEYFHGTAWAVFEKNGSRFLVAANHLAENVTVDEEGTKTTSTIWVEQVMQVIAVATERYGEMPMILNGDWYFATNLRPEAYQYMKDQGLEDVAQTAKIKHSVGIGTFHNLGENQTNWAHEDIIFTSGFKALQHQIIVDYYTINASDHYPVLADLQLIPSPVRAWESGSAQYVNFSEFVF